MTTHQPASEADSTPGPSTPDQPTGDRPPEGPHARLAAVHEAADRAALNLAAWRRPPGDPAPAATYAPTRDPADYLPGARVPYAARWPRCTATHPATGDQCDRTATAAAHQRDGHSAGFNRWGTTADQRAAWHEHDALARTVLAALLASPTILTMLTGEAPTDQRGHVRVTPLALDLPPGAWHALAVLLDQSGTLTIREDPDQAVERARLAAITLDPATTALLTDLLHPGPSTSTSGTRQWPPTGPEGRA